MQTCNRRSALFGAAAISLIPLATSPSASAEPVMAMDATSGKDSTIGPGVVMRVYGENPSIIPGYKTVRLVDFIMDPGSKTGNDPMPNPMVCHMLRGQLRVVQNGHERTRKLNDVWTCATGTVEQGFNDSTETAVMRMTFLIPT